MIDTLYDNHYKSREKLAWEFAKILNEEARELEAAGVDIIQFDEPAFNVFFDEVNEWGVATLERAIEGLKCETAVHICYGYGIKANTDWKKTLGSEWRQYEEAFPKLQNPASISSRWNATTPRPHGPDRAHPRQESDGRRH
jgi:5-methyltetrahydropteroyltriglutamate--homocysteine methyltransferase